MDEQSQGNQQVLDAMKQISDSTNNVKDGSMEMLAGGEQIVKEMKLLNQSTGKIKELMMGMTDSVQLISDAMEKVLQDSDNNQSSLNSLGNLIGSFNL
jgi:methyl-accepting chemotaxis protein